MSLFVGLFSLSIALPQRMVSLGVGLAVNRAEDTRIIFLISTIALCVVLSGE